MRARPSARPTDGSRPRTRADGRTVRRPPRHPRPPPGVSGPRQGCTSPGRAGQGAGGAPGSRRTPPTFSAPRTARSCVTTCPRGTSGTGGGVRGAGPVVAKGVWGLRRGSWCTTKKSTPAVRSPGLSPTSQTLLFVPSPRHPPPTVSRDPWTRDTPEGRPGTAAPPPPPQGTPAGRVRAAGSCPHSAQGGWKKASLGRIEGSWFGSPHPRRETERPLEGLL